MRGGAGRTALVLGIAAALLLPSQVVAGRSHETPQKERAALITFGMAVNHHRASAALSLFTTRASLRVLGHTYRGTRSIARWLHGEIRHNLQIRFTSPIRVTGATAAVFVRRTTRDGDCSRGCTESLRVDFSAGRFAGMTLSLLRVGGVKPPAPGPTIIPTPPSGPPPRVTPTIPT